MFVAQLAIALYTLSMILDVLIVHVHVCCAVCHCLMHVIYGTTRRVNVHVCCFLGHCLIHVYVIIILQYVFTHSHIDKLESQMYVI